MQGNKPFPADGEAAWNEILFEAAVHCSAMNDGAKVMVADVEKKAMKG
jgi:elongation factor P hydroxylase